MSHFVKTGTKINQLEYLKKALDRMGITFQETETTIKAEGQTSEVQIKIDECIGLARQKDGTFSMVGDPYYSKQNKVRRYYGKDSVFARDLTTAYSIEQSKGVLEAQGFTCSENEEANADSNQVIQMVYTKY
jgi:hypothetical protein